MSRTNVESVVKVLLRKRAVLAEAVAQAEAVVEARRQDVAHLDATIRLLTSDDPPRKRPGRRSGNLSRSLVGILRSSRQSLPIQAIVDKYLATSGLPAGDRSTLTPAIRRSLTNLRNRGTVSTAPGPKGGYLWRISAEASELAADSP
jgi:hypothetical protein